MILKYKVKFLLSIPLFLVSWQLQAADSDSLHVVNILVSDQSKNVREQAFQRGLSKVLVRLSGDESVVDKLPKLDARRYVQRFSYQPLAEVVINSEGEVLSQRIKIHYNGSLVEQYLHDNGLVVQGEDQLRSVVHIAIEAVNSIRKYNRVENYLTQLNVVESVNAMQARGEKAMFEVVLRGDGDTFLSLLKNDGTLLEVEINEVDVPTNNAVVAGVEQIIEKEIASSVVGSVVNPINKTPVYHFRLVQ